MQGRFYWPQLLQEMRQLLLQVEVEKEKQFQTPTGVWIERFIPFTSEGALPMGPSPGGVAPGAPGPGQPPPGSPPPPKPPEKLGGLFDVAGVTASPDTSTQPATEQVAVAEAVPTNSIVHLELHCRGVNLNHVAPDANTQIAFAVAEAFKAHKFLANPQGTELFGQMGLSEDKLTFTFQLKVKLKHPFQF
jgi:hypothetical protein